MVHISGEESELTKSSYSLMIWKHKDGKEKLFKIKDAPGNLTIRSEKYRGMKVELCRNEGHTAERQLGVRLSMNGSDSAEFLFRIDQEKLLAGKVTVRPVQSRGYRDYL